MLDQREVEKRVTEAFADKSFVAALAEIKTAEEAQKAFAERGIELTIEEVETLGELMNGGELEEASLEAVAGGGGVALVLGTLAAVSALAGAIAGWKSGKKAACGGR